MAIMKIKGVVKDYAWGNNYFLPSLLGYEESDKLQAEYWMGTHPSGEAVTLEGKKLSDKIGRRLPFLFKVLAIDSPLSLQCHPNKKQAEEGWKREKGLREKGEVHNYQDDNEKAEVLCALTPVTALCGFKEFSSATGALKAFIPHSYERLLKGKKDIRELFFSLFSLSQDDKDLILDELEKSISSFSGDKREGEFLNAEGVIETVLKKYKGDIGCVFPLMMNVIHVSPGEALYLQPGTLHAYVRGNGIELMTASDNVLRGGLTPKRIDTSELSSILYLGVTVPEKVEREEKDGMTIYLTPSPDFRLSHIKRGKISLPEADGIIIVIEGRAVITSEEGEIVLEKGETAFFEKGSSGAFLTVNGSAYMASEVFSR